MNKLLKEKSHLIEETKADGRRCCFSTLSPGSKEATTIFCKEGVYGYYKCEDSTQEEIDQANQKLGLSNADVTVIKFSTFHDPEKGSKHPELRSFSYEKNTSKEFYLDLSEEELRIIFVSLEIANLGDEVYEVQQDLRDQVMAELHNPTHLNSLNAFDREAS